MYGGAKSKFPWDALFAASISMMLATYGITEGVLAIDGTDNGRSKKTPLIVRTHTNIMIKKQAAIKMAKN